MCWMSLYTGDDGEAAARALRACREHEEQSGGHSWGLAAVVDGSLVTSKGLGRINEDNLTLTEALEVEAALGHTRFATQGTVNLQNAHPFLVYDEEGEALAALAHNGTWYGAPTDPVSDRCDSYYIARVLEELAREYPEADFADLVRSTGDYTGETITVLHRDGTGYVYAGRFGITQDGEEGVRSSGGTPIPEGEVRTV